MFHNVQLRPARRLLSLQTLKSLPHTALLRLVVHDLQDHNKLFRILTHQVVVDLMQASDFFLDLLYDLFVQLVLRRIATDVRSVVDLLYSLSYTIHNRI